MDELSLSLSVEALLVGSPALLAPRVMSAMGKRPVRGPVRIGWLGLEGDSVADPLHHGGHDKAVHLVPQEHYAWWRGVLDDHPLLHAPGAFGENLATRGATEANLCLGDRFALGSAVLEISHGRQPCAKLNARFGRKDVLGQAIASGHCGLYLRVIEQGEAKAGDAMILLERPLEDWPIARVFNLLIAGGHKADPAGVAQLAETRVLADAWRVRAEKLAR
ncbi:MULTISPECIES: MOSC domain-containing protein [unclassified Sphingobium]|uniref:MOSC domain-containing protein n=1 Tax=unclassified Sphingobium TaxID=2611147 RepID=UPI002223F6D4|nr:MULTISPECIES: MOSC domain-containing protein [unclassified Sphingobium]MCW2394330.1 MOSC domain-containing protein YiiM [Sphingobium sp. B8D3B]MCW2417844.1 MOSC domain-containing protein YiiM [Sphingobium sp. B8D3C]